MTGLWSRVTYESLTRPNALLRDDSSGCIESSSGTKNDSGPTGRSAVSPERTTERVYMEPRSPITIQSWELLRAHISEIVTELNRDVSLARAAAVNPFLALDELGYFVPDDVRESIGDRLRFP